RPGSRSLTKVLIATFSCHIGYALGVIPSRDEKAGAAGSLWDLVRDRRLNHRLEVIDGVLADECARLLTDFFRSR
ncbi:hypothetical protein ACWDAF_08900, partial [Streptomyces sp. NPDC001226]